MIHVTFIEHETKHELLAECEVELLPRLHERVWLETSNQVRVHGLVTDVTHRISGLGSDYMITLKVFRRLDLKGEAPPDGSTGP